MLSPWTLILNLISKPHHGNMRHVFDGAKFGISNTPPSATHPCSIQTSRALQFECWVADEYNTKNMAHITVKLFINY